MVAGCGANISKIILFIFNFCVWLVGIALIVVGAIVVASPDKYDEFFGSTNTLTIAAGFIIAVGCLIFLLAFAGCCGAIKESSCLLKVYIALLVVLVILEIVGGILAIVFRDSIRDVMETELKRQIKDDYVYTAEHKTSIDLLQMEGKCCGAADYKDWIGSKFQVANVGRYVPVTCCQDVEDVDCNLGIFDESKIYETGCIDSFVQTIEEYFVYIAAFSLGLVVVEILAMIFACCVICGIDKGEYE